MIKRVEHKAKAKERLKKCKSGMIGANILSDFLNWASVGAIFWARLGVLVTYLFIIGATAGVGGLAGMMFSDTGEMVGALLSAGVVGIVLGIVVDILFVISGEAVSGAAEIGNTRYYLFTSKHGIKPAMTTILEGFNDFWNVFLTYARRALIILVYRLPGILLVILAAFLVESAPGAAIFMLILGLLEMWLAGWFASLLLWAVPWIKADRPELSSGRCIEESKKMCKGHIGDLLVLRLSFIGWDMLSFITGNLVGLLYYTPYFRQTNALIYQELKGAAIELNDFENAEAIRGTASPSDRMNDFFGAEQFKKVVGQVIGVSGSFQGKVVELTPGVPVIIGRGDNANIRISGVGAENVSGNHCTIRFNRERDCYEVTDTSSNGTLVNGNRLTKGVTVSLPCGAEICLADARNRLRLDKVAK